MTFSFSFQLWGVFHEGSQRKLEEKKQQQKMKISKRRLKRTELFGYKEKRYWRATKINLKIFSMFEDLVHGKIRGCS